MSQHKQTLMQTAAGRRFIAFLTIFNSGNADRLRTYIAENTTEKALESQSVDDRWQQLIDTMNEVGKLRVHQVVAADDHYIVVLVQAKNTGDFYINEYKVDEEYPHKVMKYTHHLADESR